MAALQTLRSKPALLMSVIGGALLLFIITMVMENNSGLFGVSDEAGEAFGNEIKVNDLESKISEEQNLQEIATFLNNFFQTGQMDYQRLTEEQRAQIRQTVWDNFVNHGAIEQEANKLGLIVTDAEMQAALKTPTTFEAQFLMMVGQFAYSNPTIEGYKKFINEFDKQLAQISQANPDMAELFVNIKRACFYAEAKLKSSLLEQKYLNLIRTSYTTNPIAAKMAFDEENTLLTVAVSAIPYTTIPDDTVKVSDDEIKARYDEFKANFFTPMETRNVKVIDFVVNPSTADNQNLIKEVKALEDTLRKTSSMKDIATIVSGSKTTINYNQAYFKKDAFKESQLMEVYNQLDSMGIGSVSATKSDAQFVTTFKLVDRKNTADSLNIRSLAARDAKQADSLLNALKGGAAWGDLAKKLGQKDTTMWQATPYYVAQEAGDSSKYTDPCQMPLNTPCILGNYVVEVIGTKGNSDKYNVAVIKCPIEYSDVTYSAALSRLNDFVANHKDANKFEEEGKKAGFTVYSLPAMTTSDYMQFVNVCGDGGKDAVRWLFDEAKPGQVSNVYESRNAKDESHLVTVALVSVSDGDYLPWDHEVVKNYISGIIRQEKKAEMILGKTKNVKTMADMQKIQGAQNDTLQNISLAQVPYNDYKLAGSLAKAQKGQFVGNIKAGTGIFAIQVIEKTTKNKTFNASVEMAKIESRKLYENFATQSMYGRQMGQYPTAFLNELIMRNGKVKDNRYKF